MKKLYLAIAFLTFVVLGACGGGGNNTPPIVTPPPTGGIVRTGIAFGPVSTFGSVVVGGVHYDTTNTTFTVDDNPSTQDALDVGDIVTVTGTIDDDGVNGTAESISSDDDVTGPIDSIDLALSQLVVLSQLVQVSPDTSFDANISPASLDGLVAGDIVEVHGFFMADGSIAATRIEKKGAGVESEVHGTVSSLDGANFTFMLNTLLVDYSGATLTDFPSGQINDGDFVEAKGSIGAAGELVATTVDMEDKGINGDDGDHVEVEGFITRFVSETDFDVAGVTVTSNSNTVFEGGDATDLGLNIKVEVEGELDANGTLVATKIDIRRSKAVRTEALVDSVDAANGTLVTLGITVSTDTLTRFEDKSSADLRPLTINDISAGDYLEVRGTEFPAGSGAIQATVLERDDVDTRTELQGFVQSATDPELVILGVTIDTTGAIFRDVDGTIIADAATFFGMLVVDTTLVKARGTETGDTSIAATEVELELEL